MDKIEVGDGFYADGRDWYWMSAGGQIRIFSGALPGEVSFQLACGCARHYTPFPFEVCIYQEKILIDRRRFEFDNHTHHVSVNLTECESETHLRLESSAFFVPQLCGVGPDSRQLSVRLSRLRVEPPTIHRECPVCKVGNPEKSRLLGSLENNCQHVSDLGPHSYQLLQCSECELIYLSPLPSKEALDELYVNNIQFSSPEYRGLRELVTLANYWRQMRWLRKLVGNCDSGFRVLEVGSGLSWMCRSAKLIDRKATTVAQDISPEKMGSCPWVDHYVLGELHLKKAEIEQFAPYQIISLTHVIEHLPEPIETLKICREFLGTTGVLFVSAPHRPRGWRDSAPISLWRNWAYNHVPAHLQYFNEHSMKRCGEQAGLDVFFFSTSPGQGESLDALLCRPESQLPKRL